MTDLRVSYLEQISKVEARMAQACRKVNRNVNDITLVAVSKTKSVEEVSTMAAAGIKVFGENKAQELIEKSTVCSSDLQWHFIGKIQTNKLKKIASRSHMIHSVDSIKQLEILSNIENPPELLLQLSSDGDPTRGGVIDKELPNLLAKANTLNLNVVGLMHVPPVGADARQHFKNAKQVCDDLGLSVLSIGMSNDYEIAIECGATIIRVGSALFGDRI